MSPLTLKRIKDAKGQVRVSKSDNSARQPTIVEWSIQIMENGSWQTIFKDRERSICEQMITKASRQVILG